MAENITMLDQIIADAIEKAKQDAIRVFIDGYGVRELVKLQNLLKEVRTYVAQDAMACVASAYLNGTDTEGVPSVSLLKKIDEVCKEKYLEVLTGEDFAALGFGEDDW